MHVMSKNFQTLDAELERKREEVFELKDQLRSSKEMLKNKDEKIAFLVDQLKKLKEEKEVASNVLDSTQTTLGKAIQKLEKIRVNTNHLSFLKRKARLYPL